MKKKTDYKSQGKKNREAGARFELKVKEDLIKKGWIVDRWTNNIELPTTIVSADCKESVRIENKGRLITAKPKTLFINGRRVIINMWTGFPDFVAFTNRSYMNEIIVDGGLDIPLVASDGKTPMNEPQERYALIGVESKSNGYLTKEEKLKCKWLLENNVFSKILVAKKGSKRGEIVYDEIN